MMAQVIQRIWRSGPRKVKRVSWGFTFQRDGRQIRKYDATWSKDDAQAALSAMLLEVDAPEKKPAPTGVTFKALTVRYLAEKQAAKKKTIRADRDTITKLVAYFGADTLVAEITAPKIAEYRLMRLTTTSARTKRTLAPVSVNLELSILRGLLRMAASDECQFIERAPTVRMLPEPEGRLRFLSDDEATRLLAECQRAGEPANAMWRSPELYAIVTVALNTGMRKSEVLGLTWSRVDFARGVLLLEKTKSGKRREIPMNRDVYTVLASRNEHQRADERVGRVFRARSFQAAFTGACTRAGVSDFRFHDLRHTFASRLTMLGRPLREVQELLGHSSITMTERYGNLAPERFRDAVAALEKFSTTSAHEPGALDLAEVTTLQN
jgi:integrase